MDPLAIPAGTLVIGDLHLAPTGGAGVDAFVEWLDRLSDVPQLVIVGDLFDAWVGHEQVRLAGTIPVLDALKRLSWRGTRVDVLHGNRDFLLDGFFEAWTGAHVWPEGLVAALPDGARALVVHGDELCTEDRSYQRLKFVLRARVTKGALRRLPFFVKRRLAAGLRAASRRAVPAKPAPRKAMQENACRALAAEREVALLVCGHAHRFQDVQVEGGPRWIVLDAFGGERDCVVVGASDVGAHCSRLGSSPLRLL
ncbi:MAG: UDP-2,3-diacylglucosamine diphosphatase [bacterium]|nr:UDP-2,3-diacylglucosamine diphosphatase [bacterium]